MTWLTNNYEQVVELTLVHLLLSLPAVLLSALLAVPAGFLGHRVPRVGRPLGAAAALLYAVPALPLLIVLPALLGTPLRSPVTLVAALTVYGVALLVRTATDAFDAVPAVVRASATAVGFSGWSRFWRVELPLAAPVLLSGVRVVAVSTVALTSIGALVGISSLGTLLTDGFQRGLVAEVTTGVVVIVVLALLLDGLCVLAGRLLLPWSRT